MPNISDSIPGISSSCSSPVPKDAKKDSRNYFGNLRFRSAAELQHANDFHRIYGLRTHLAHRTESYGRDSALRIRLGEKFLHRTEVSLAHLERFTSVNITILSGLVLCYDISVNHKALRKLDYIHPRHTLRRTGVRIARNRHLRNHRAYT